MANAPGVLTYVVEQWGFSGAMGPPLQPTVAKPRPRCGAVGLQQMSRCMCPHHTEEGEELEGGEGRTQVGKAEGGESIHHGAAFGWGGSLGVEGRLARWRRERERGDSRAQRNAKLLAYIWCYLI